ncbi:hypothetical protein KMS_R31480 [Pseudomonas sp. LRP2-20]|nr:hypothetical protein [Pseudomonas sp. LRP2-20]BDM23391.1 hypothetical protein KMS_R31480 [Pseudomonas sp. LRP2-20]
MPDYVGKRQATGAFCISNPGVHVIDCPVDYSENDRILNTGLRARALDV